MTAATVGLTRRTRLHSEQLISKNLTRSQPWLHNTAWRIGEAVLAWRELIAPGFRRTAGEATSPSTEGLATRGAADENN